MHKNFLNFSILAIVMSVFVSMPAAAERPAWAGNDKAGKHGHHEEEKWNKSKNHQNYRGRNQNDLGKNRNYQGGDQNYRSRNNYATRNFDDRQRALVHDYFGPRFQSGVCPPGLAKKYNGCMPPGQVKKWRIGHPLPSNVIFYSLPPLLLGQLGYPGPRYRYVRVAADVLLIAAGTGMVLAAIEDLNSM